MIKPPKLQMKVYLFENGFIDNAIKHYLMQPEFKNFSKAFMVQKILRDFIFYQEPYNFTVNNNNIIKKSTSVTINLQPKDVLYNWYNKYIKKIPYNKNSVLKSILYYQIYNIKSDISIDVDALRDPAPDQSKTEKNIKVLPLEPQIKQKQEKDDFTSNNTLALF